MLILNNPIERLSQLKGSDSRVVIAMAGLPGSGKSTYADYLKKEMKDDLVVLGMDGFHYPKKVLSTFANPEEAFARRGAPWTFDAKKLVEKCKALRLDQDLQWPDFQHGVGDPVEEAIQIKSDSNLILIEGIYLLYRDGDWAGLKGLFDELWYLDISEELAQSRIVKRHMKSSGLSEEQATQKAKLNDLLNGKYVIESRERADYIISDDTIE